MYLFDDFGPGVVVLIDSVSESEEYFFSGLDFHDEFADVFFASNAFQHSNDGFIGSTVLGPIESPSSHRDGSVDIDA